MDPEAAAQGFQTNPMEGQTLEQQQIEPQQMQQISVEQHQMIEQSQIDPQPVDMGVDQQVTVHAPPVMQSPVESKMMNRPSSGKGTKWYAVRSGKKTGIFTSWDETRDLVYGYQKASFKSFNTEEEARNWLTAEPQGPSTVSRSSSKRSRGDGTSDAAKRWKVAFDNIKINDDDVLIFSDGSCIRNPGPGGYAYLVVMQPMFMGRPTFQMIARSGCEVSTTNNRMELLGITQGLRCIPRSGANVQIFIDSSYIKRGVNDWFKTWKMNGWRTTEGGPIKNKELWEDMDRLMSMHNLQWHFVEPHAGVIGSNLVDGMALRAATTQQCEEAVHEGDHVLQYLPGRRGRASMGGQLMHTSAASPPSLHLGHGDGLPPAAHLPDFGVVNFDNLPPLPPVR